MSLLIDYIAIGVVSIGLGGAVGYLASRIAIKKQEKRIVEQSVQKILNQKDYFIGDKRFNIEKFILDGKEVNFTEQVKKFEPKGKGEEVIASPKPNDQELNKEKEDNGMGKTNIQGREV